MRDRLARAVFVAALALFAPAAMAACLDEGRIEAMVEAWRAAEPIRGLPPELGMKDALCIRDRLVDRLKTLYGRVSGYKAGLTNKAVQQRFGYASPVRGALFENTLLSHGALVPARFGARPVIEADLLVEVGDEAINEAHSHLDALKALARVMPFIELADLGFAEGEPITAPKIVAINVGARGGIIGRPVAVEASQAFADMLAGMRVVLTDDTGKEISNSPGTAILEHPLNAVIWLVRDLRQSGIRLKPGDQLSLGSFSPLVAPRPSVTYTVRYPGLPGGPHVSVRFK